MVDDLPGELVVDVLHPPRFFALAFPDSPCLFSLLQGLAAGIEAPPQHTLIAAVAEEPRPRPADMSHRRHFDAQINAHDALLLDRLGFGKSHRDISDPLAPLLLDAQEAGESIQSYISATDLEWLRLAIQGDWYGQRAALDAPVLMTKPFLHRKDSSTKPGVMVSHHPVLSRKALVMGTCLRLVLHAVDRGNAGEEHICY